MLLPKESSEWNWQLAQSNSNVWSQIHQLQNWNPKVRQFKIVEDKAGNKSELKYGYTSDWKSKKPQDNEDFEVLYPFTWDADDIDKSKRYI